jgi:Arc/MetJ-type ribon-helix-helix transcriptional regulator
MAMAILASNGIGIANCNQWYNHPDMELISVKLPPELRAKVAAEARRRNVSQSSIVRESLELVLGHPTSRGEANCADLAGSLVGSVRTGRRDFSTNKKLLADAMVSNARRGRKHHR